MKIQLLLLLWLLGQISTRADSAKRLETEAVLSTFRGGWEDKATQIIQIVRYRGDTSIDIDSIIQHSNGEITYARDEIIKQDGSTKDWLFSRKAIRNTKPLDPKELAILYDVSPIHNLQKEINGENRDYITTLRRVLRVYTIDKKWTVYELLTVPNLEKSPEIYQKWEEAFLRNFRNNSLFKSQR